MTAAEEIQRIRVVNRNEFAIKDMFDGVPVVLEPNKPVELPMEVAQHILNYPGETEDRFRHMARRWGWNLPANAQTQFPGHHSLDKEGVPLWVRMCEKIEVAIARFEVRPITDPSAPIPADDGAAEDIERIPHLTEQTVARRKKTRKEISRARSERMKAFWAARRAAAGPHASPISPPLSPSVGEQRPDGTAPRVIISEGAS